MVAKSNILKSLSNFTSIERSYILEELLKSSNTNPIDIDGKVYYVHKDVSKLIDDLVLQIKEISSLRFPLNNYGDIESN
jgi:uncharacterized protein (UPF0216 family)